MFVGTNMEWVSHKVSKVVPQKRERRQGISDRDGNSPSVASFADLALELRECLTEQNQVKSECIGNVCLPFFFPH